MNNPANLLGQYLARVPNARPVKARVVERDCTDLGTRNAIMSDVRYYNFTGKDLWMVLRDGSAVKIPSSGTSRDPTLEGRLMVEQIIDHTMRPDLIELEDNPQLHLLSKEEIDRIPKWRLNTKGRGYVKTSYHHYEDIKDAGGFIYSTDLDVVFVDRTGKTRDDDWPIHPHSVLQECRESLDDAPVKQNPCGLLFELIDNENLIGEHYVNVGGHVVTITPQKDKDRPCGFYVYTWGWQKLGNAAKNNILTYISVTDYDTDKSPYKFFKSARAALEFGDEITRKERELKAKQQELDAELLRLKKDIANDKYDADKDILEEERKARKRKAKQERKDFERDLKKKYEEDRLADKQAQRKDLSDIIKLGISVVTLVISLVAIARK